MQFIAIISNVILLFGVFVFTNSWTVGTSNHKKVLKESLIIYVLPLFLVQALLAGGAFYLQFHGKEQLAGIGWIILLVIGFSPLWFWALIGLIGILKKK